MRYHEIINEHYVNLHTDEEKAEYGQIVYDLVATAYGPIGGHCNYNNAEELIADTNMWKLVRRGGEIVMVALYKDRNGRKLVGIGHNGTSSAKSELARVLVDDMKMKRCWYEASGATAKILMRAGVPLIPAERAGEVLGKEINSVESEFVYTRMIGGHPHKKILCGWPTGGDYGQTTPDSISDVMDALA